VRSRSPIYALVLVETLIFGGDEGLLEEGRDGM
jgi:hypothetical protein